MTPRTPRLFILSQILVYPGHLSTERAMNVWGQNAIDEWTGSIRETAKSRAQNSYLWVEVSLPQVARLGPVLKLRVLLVRKCQVLHLLLCSCAEIPEMASQYGSYRV